ncbi:MAG: carboxypeptidase-like regulatory domain-containing protein [Patescibacteria group bacterium]
MRKTTLQAVRGVLASFTILATVLFPYGGLTIPAASALSSVKTISGQVTYEGTSTGVAGAQVNAWSFGGSGGNTTTDGSGNYSFLVPGGDYQMNLWASNPATADWTYNEPPVQVNFSQDENAQSETRNFKVKKATATLTGTVTKTDGTAVTQGGVGAWSQGGSGGSSVQLNGSSTYVMRLPAGTFNASYWSSDPSLTATQQIITVKDGETVTANFVVKQKTAHITGVLLDSVTGSAAANVRINAFCQDANAGSPGQGPMPGVFGNATSEASGAFDIALLAGRCFVNIDQFVDQQNQSAAQYVFTGDPRTMEVTLETDTTSKNMGNVNLTKTDATILVRIKDESGNPIQNFPGFVGVEKPQAEGQFGGPGNHFGGPVMNGVATIKVPTTVSTSWLVRVHTPPNAEYSVGSETTVTVASGGTAEATVNLVKNNSAVYGSLVSDTGIPMNNCTAKTGQPSFGDVFLMGPGGHRNAQIKPDCSFEISVVAGTYQFGYHFFEGNGLLNRPPSQDPVVVKAGERSLKNISVLAGDATIKGRLLDPSGKPVANAFVNASNDVEYFGRPGQSGPGGTGGPGGPGKPKEIGQGEFKGKNDAGDIFQVCMNAKQKKDTKIINECKAKKLPGGFTGPGGCSNVMSCVDFCTKKENQSECGKFKGPEQGPGGQNKPVSGPGGCKTDAECKAFCNKPENAKTCQQFGPGPNQGFTGASFFKGKVKGATNEDNVGPGPNAFQNILHSGAPTDANGVFSISVVSGHKYSVRAFPQPGSAFMPAQEQVVDLSSAKSASVDLILRTADAKITGTVTGGGTHGHCGGFSEDANHTGGPIMNGRFEINVSKGVWHIMCDAPSGNDMYRSDEVTIVVSAKGTITQNMKLEKNNFRVPSPISKTFDVTQPQTLSLDDGTEITIPANALGTSGNATVTATPTANVTRTKEALPAMGFGYELEAINASTGAEITDFNSNVTIEYQYPEDKELETEGLDESSFKPQFFNETKNSWEAIENATQDKTDNTYTVLADHFSIHAVTTSGKAGALKTVTKLTGKSKGSVKIDKTTVKAFAGVSVNAATANYGGTTGQLVFVSPAETLKSGTAVVKVFTTKGKLVKTLTPCGNSKNAISLVLTDVTKDGKSDVLASQNSGTCGAKVYDVKGKYKTYALNLGAQARSTVSVTTMEAHQVGVASIAALVKSGAASDVKVFKFNKGKFTEDTSINESSKRIKISGSSVSLLTLKPSGKASASLSSTKTTSKVNLAGENFETGMVATIGTVAGAVKVTNGKVASITFDGTKLTKGKKTLKLVNPSGGSGSISVTVK